MMKTTMYDTISSIRPFFFSLREIKNKVSLDIKIPPSWKYQEEEKNDVTITLQDENERTRLISIISIPTKEGYDNVFSTAKKIITFNQEIEEKDKLFNEKIEELKKYFLEAPIDKLKEISFVNKSNVRSKKSSGEIGLGKEEGPGTDGSI